VRRFVIAAALCGVASATVSGCRAPSSDTPGAQGGSPPSGGPHAASLLPGVPGALTTVSAALQTRPSSAARSDGTDAGEPPVVRVSELEPAAPPDACPPTMVYVAGGDFWMGSPRGRSSVREEQPRFRTQVASFCLDTYEVTAASYAQCVEQGKCSEPHGSQSKCNYGRREDHPINCVDWQQADAYCKSQGSRLPTELEWEYAARGGERYYAYAWGSEPPDERTCWKTSQSCPVGSFAPGAFGTRDLSGNVWEWTHDWYGEYPWPTLEGRAKAFRGGGWSRKRESSLSSTLRGRTHPRNWGSHLGFRCARLAQGAQCPFGPGDEPGFCRHGVLDAECATEGQRFNGQRCAPAGAPVCAPGQEVVPGHGCVRRTGASAEL
jgi:formylglycine-generating enzyme required for sulfatase activity